MENSISFKARLLGAPVIEAAGFPIQVDTRKAIALLVFLIVAGDLQPRDLLAALLWPDLDQSHARSALRRTLSSLKNSLGGQGLIVHRESIGLDTNAGWWVDLQEFEDHLAKISNHIHSTKACRQLISHLSTAVDLVRGDFLAGFSLRDSAPFDDWQSLQSSVVHQNLSQALENLTACQTYLGEYEQAIHYARRSKVIDPLNEKTARELMRLYTWSGRRDAGMQQYHDLAQVLKSELQVSPAPETTKLYTEILENNLTPPHIRRVRTEAQPIREFPLLSSSYPLVGRQEELDELIDFYESSASLRAFMVIEGEIGIGKTRLAEEFLSNASQGGSVVISTRFFPQEINLPYGPFIEGIRSSIDFPGLTKLVVTLPDLWKVELSRLLPEVVHLVPGEQSTLLVNTAQHQARLYEALDRLIQWICQGPHPGILFLDDLQWADQASVDLLTYLLHKTSGQSLFILGTWRSEDVRPGNRLRDLLVDAQRLGKGKLISLGRLDQAEVSLLLHSLPGKELPPYVIERLYLESEGLPYFLTQYLSVIHAADQQSTNAGFPLPSSIRELLDSRLAKLSPAGIKLLSVASVIGRSFDFDILCTVSRQGEEACILSLEELLAKGLIQGSAGQGMENAITYDFVHDKLRSLVYEEVSRPRRRKIHEQIAEALAQRLSEANELSLSGQVAFHYRQAGKLSLASQYSYLAGEYARSIFAIPDALHHYQMSLSLGYPDQAVLHEAIGDLHTLLGAYPQALEEYQACLTDLTSQQAASIYYKMAQVNHRLGDWIAAEENYQQALDQLSGSRDLVLQVNILVDRSLTSLYRDGLSSARELANQALSTAQQAQDCRSLSQVYNILGILDRREGSPETALEHLETSLEYAELANDRPGSIAALNNLARTQGERGEFNQAILLAQKALELCALIGDRHREAALLSNLADLYYSAGEAETAMIHLKKSVAIFSEIGASAGDIQPEIWKMTEW